MTHVHVPKCRAARGAASHYLEHGGQLRHLCGGPRGNRPLGSDPDGPTRRRLTAGAGEGPENQLATADFPVNELEIVGSGLRSVERVTGRMTVNRAVASGVGSGAWAGLFVGLLVGLFTGGAVWVGLVVGGLLIGAVWGALLAVGLRWMSRGHHNFSSLHCRRRRHPIRHHRSGREGHRGPLHPRAGP